jgi:hypothetical protein
MRAGVAAWSARSLLALLTLETGKGAYDAEMKALAATRP